MASAQNPTTAGTEYRYRVFFGPLPEGGYNVRFPAIPEICTFGTTIEDARAMAADALRCYLQSALANGEEIPVEHGPAQVENVAVSV